MEVEYGNKKDIGAWMLTAYCEIKGRNAGRTKVCKH